MIYEKALELSAKIGRFHVVAPDLPCRERNDINKTTKMSEEKRNLGKEIPLFLWAAQSRRLFSAIVPNCLLYHSFDILSSGFLNKNYTK